jgi:hypothetical protein
VLSNSEARLAQLTKAIDDLAADGLTGLPPGQMVERVARVWALVETLDPELARRRDGYADSSAATFRRSAGNPA